MYVTTNCSPVSQSVSYIPGSLDLLLWLEKSASFSNFRYLGSIIEASRDIKMEVENRIAYALRALVCNAVVLSVYCCMNWDLGWIGPSIAKQKFSVFLCSTVYCQICTTDSAIYPLLSNYAPLTEQYTPCGYNCSEYSAESWVYMPYMTTYSSFDPSTQYSIVLPMYNSF